MRVSEEERNVIVASKIAEWFILQIKFASLVDRCFTVHVIVVRFIE